MESAELFWLAGNTGLSQVLGARSLNLALGESYTWHAAGLDLAVAVPVSDGNPYDPQLMDTISGALSRCNTPAAFLEVEIGESAIGLAPERAMEIVRALHGLGVRISIHRFGKCYSSLECLNRLPAAAIVIDASFVADVALNAHHESLVTSIVELGHCLGFQVVANGVENLQTWKLLQKLGADLAQGSYLSGQLMGEELQTRFSGGSPALTPVLASTVRRG